MRSCLPVQCHCASSLNRVVTGGRGESDQHDSLTQLRHLTWLNVDGNQLTDIDVHSLPPKLDTLSAAHNRISQFPATALVWTEMAKTTKTTIQTLLTFFLSFFFFFFFFFLFRYVKAHLEELSWLDLRGNHIRQVPTDSIGIKGHNQSRLDKLDLGENLISELVEDAMFNQSLQVINTVN